MSTWQWLGYLGLIPFIICVFFPTFITNHWHISTEKVFIFYSAIILSFLSGTLWRARISPSNSWVQLASNILCLFAYICLFLPINWALALLPFGYFGLLIIEYGIRNSESDVLSSRYLIMRLTLTLIVIVLHVILLINQYH
jgi:hypothetical protein